MKPSIFSNSTGKGNVRNIQTAVITEGDEHSLLIKVDLKGKTWPTTKKNMVASAGQFGVQVDSVGENGLWFNLNCGFNLPAALLKRRKIEIAGEKAAKQLAALDAAEAEDK